MFKKKKAPVNIEEVDEKAFEDLEEDEEDPEEAYMDDVEEEDEEEKSKKKKSKAKEQPIQLTEKDIFMLGVSHIEKGLSLLKTLQ